MSVFGLQNKPKYLEFMLQVLLSTIERYEGLIRAAVEQGLMFYALLMIENN